MRHWAWGMGHGAWGMGHGAWGMRDGMVGIVVMGTPGREPIGFARAAGWVWRETLSQADSWYVDPCGRRLWAPPVVPRTRIFAIRTGHCAVLLEGLGNVGKRIGG